MSEKFIVLVVSNRNIMECLLDVTEEEGIAIWRGSATEVLRNFKLAEDGREVKLPDLLIVCVSASATSRVKNVLSVAEAAESFNVPVLAITLLSEESEGYKQAENLVSRIITFPFDPKELVAVIKGLTSLHQEIRQAWFCEKCGVHGLVVINPDDNQGLTVIAKIAGSHRMASPHCDQPVEMIKVMKPEMVK